jgi:hypothetical protein
VAAAVAAVAAAAVVVVSPRHVLEGGQLQTQRVLVFAVAQLQEFLEHQLDQRQVATLAVERLAATPTFFWQAVPPER